MHALWVAVGIVNEFHSALLRSTKLGVGLLSIVNHPAAWLHERPDLSCGLNQCA